MEKEWMDDYFLSKKGTRKDYQPDWQATRYFLSDKMYAMVGGDKFGEPIVTMKCDPVFAEILRLSYPGIVPGYYMNKKHWNSTYLKSDTPDEVIRDMIDTAYRLILESLPKAVQAGLLSEEMQQENSK